MAEEMLETVLVFLNGSTGNSVRCSVVDVAPPRLTDSTMQIAEFVAAFKFNGTSFKELS